MLKKLSLYVHIPFCIQKCYYCDFASFVCNSDVQDKYTTYLLKEIDLIKDNFKGHYLDTVFFGGGTPTNLTEKNLLLIMNKIKASFYIDDDAEFSIECNPKTADFNKFKFLRELGFNRLSIGVQALDDDILRKIGRAHNVKDFLECYASLKLAGFENVNYDLMFALPDQRFEDFKKTARDIVKFKPTHISCYSLTLEENTPLYKNIHKYYTADDEENRNMYGFAKKFFEENGYLQYEISNFAKRGFECRHNLKYWELGEYIGIGSSASSFFNNARHTNPHLIEDYMKFIDDYKFPYIEPTETEKDLMGEFMFLGLRKTNGIKDKEFTELFNKSFFDVYKEEIENNMQKGLLIKENDTIKLTTKGQDLANIVMSDFV